MDRRGFLRAGVVLAAGAAVAGAVAVRLSEDDRTPPTGPVYRAFAPSSEWNRPLPREAPVDPRSVAFVASLAGFGPGSPFPTLADGRWAEPIFWAGRGDPEHTVQGLPFPVRIPADAEPAASNDAQLTVYDLERGYVIKLQGVVRDGGSWGTPNTSIYYLASNGLAGTVRGSDDPRNRGHRGFPPPIHAVRWDEVQAGEIAHVLKVAIQHTAPWHVYPAAGDEHGTGSVPEGAMFRIKPWVDLRRRGLRGGALTIAQAMQTYGFVIGDQSGVPMALKLENLEAEGSPHRWSDVGITSDSLSAIGFDDLHCIELGYRRP
jgi:hypothetical protein